MKPVNAAITHQVSKSPVKSEMVSNEDTDGDVTQNSLLDALRNTYISEKSSMVFRQATASIFNDQFPKVSLERQAVIDEFLQKFMKFSNEEQLLFYLRLPHSSNTVPNLNNESKLGILASRVEIRRTAAWIRSHLQIDNESSIPKRDVYDKYMEYCQYSRMIPISIADFGKVMKQLYPTVRPRRLGTRGQSQYCYSGMNSCQDLHRPNLYEENSRTDFDQFPEQCGSIYPVVECQAKPQDYNSLNDLKTKSQDCDRKCRNRKSTLCQRSRWRRHFCRKDQSVEHTPDGPVEDEIAQYFDTSDHTFCRPLKIVKGPTNRPTSSIYRSLSYTGGQSDTSTPHSRCHSSVSTHGSPWLALENPNNSSGSLNDQSHGRSGLRPRSCLSRNERSSLETRHCFTPISPSPIPWRPFSSAHVYTEENHSPFRPRSFSSTEQKWAIPRALPKIAFDEPTCEQNLVDSNHQKSNDSNRSQSLPSFKDGLIPQLSTNYDNGFANMDMTNDELSDMLNNSMVVENICDVKIEEDLLPQLDNILESIKNPCGMNVDNFVNKDHFQMLSNEDITDLNISEESLRQNFESFF